MPPTPDQELLARERELRARVQPLLAPDEVVVATIVYSRDDVRAVKSHARRRAAAWVAVAAAVAVVALGGGLVVGGGAGAALAAGGTLVASGLAGAAAYSSFYWYRASKRRAVITNRRLVSWTRWRWRGRHLRSAVESLVFAGGRYVDLRTRPFAGTEVGDIVVRDERGKRVFKIAGALYPYHVAGVLADAVRSSVPAQGPVRVFLSYRRDDVDDVGGWLRSELARRVIEVFVDVHDLVPGDRWADELEARVADATALVLLVGPGWVESATRLHEEDDWVRREVELALQHDVAIVPVLVRGAELPARDELPPSVAGLLDRQATDLPTDGLFTGAVKRLAEALAAIHLSAEPR